MNKATEKSNLSAWIFVLLSCAFIVTIGYKTNLSEPNTDNSNVLVESKETIKNKKIIVEIEKEEYNNDDNQKNIQETIEEIFISDNESLDEEKNDIYVNKIIISKNIDDDKNSDTYRNPIDAFKTISTLDESVIKEIDYYPSLFVWASINTENISLINEEQEFKPINLSMALKCKGQLIEKIDYNITAKTPRWREWIEIDLETVDARMLNEFWNVEITDNRNDSILESRNFKLINEQQVLEQVNLDR